MGAVYEVEHRELRKAFVLKILHDDLSDLEDSVQRIRSESRFLARIEHPNIIKVTDAGSTKYGVPFFVMERLEGETLASRMRRLARWRVLEVVQLSNGVLDALIAAHRLGIVHRDIKPSNIFLTRESGVKLLDFGIAKSLGVDATATAKGVTLGTPRYMAPEQAMGGQADCRSDLYSLGIIMYELLAGEHPFAHALTPIEMLIAQAGWQVPPLPNDHTAEMVINPIVSRLLSKDPDARPHSARAVKAAILSVERVIVSAASAPKKDDEPLTRTASCNVVYLNQAHESASHGVNPLRLGCTRGHPKRWLLIGVFVSAIRMGSSDSSLRASAESATTDTRNARVERHAQRLPALTLRSTSTGAWIGMSAATAYEPPAQPSSSPTALVHGSACDIAKPAVERKAARSARTARTRATARPAERPIELENLTRR